MEFYLAAKKNEIFKRVDEPGKYSIKQDDPDSKAQNRVFSLINGFRLLMCVYVCWHKMSLD